MQPADKIRELFKNGKLAVHPDTDEQVFRDVLRAHQETKENPPDFDESNQVKLPASWRITMRSPITKLAIAAVLVIACLMGMMMWKGTGSNVALADVLTKIEQVAAYTYEMHLTTTGHVPSVVPTTISQQMEATILTAQGLGEKMTMTVADPNTGITMRQEMYMAPQKKIMLMVMHDQKQYMQMDLDDSMFEKAESQNNNPRALVEQILNCNYTNLGRSTIDGVQVEGFETTDPKYMGGAMGQVDVKIWVDVKTQLPVRSEIDLQPGQIHIHGIVDNFRWNVSVDPRELDPVIPAGYTSMSGGPMKIPPMNEETAIQGLKLFADMSGGRYPEELDVLALSGKLAELSAKQIVKDANSASRDETMKKLTGKMMPITMAAAFYGTLVQGNKEPAYYGKTVTPQDADKVLLRWKVSDTEYRVIFGNLMAQTLKADVLAELEKDLPK
jgi:hypothetical protein